MKHTQSKSKTFCSTYTGNNFIYSQTNNTILVGKCGVECINNQVKTGYICSNYKWLINQDNESNDNNSNNK